MKYLNPLLWYEVCDENYEYNKDEHLVKYKNNVDKARSKIRSYETFKEPLSDGLLVSRTMLESRGKIEKIKGKFRIVTYYNKKGFTSIREFSSYNKPKIIFADPGTWSYVNKRKLPDFLYDTNSLIDYYTDLKFDLAGSVDWPIIDKIKEKVNGKIILTDLDIKTKEMRRKLTLELAKDFIQKCSKRSDISFMPFGAIQGYSTESYRDSVRQILKMGYKYIAIGGLPSSSEQYVIELLKSLRSEFLKYGKGLGLHLYGRFPSPKVTRIFLKLGVTSFDNNSSFICASGKSATCLFFDPVFRIEGPTTLANCFGIKIPNEKSPHDKTFQKLRKVVSEKDLEYYKSVAKHTFDLFCEYSQNTNKKVLKTFLQSYSEILVIMNEIRSTPYSKAKIEKLVDNGRQVLKLTGWKRCGCSSCRLLQAHIVLNRGNNRIVNTFAHNTHVQYVRFLRELIIAKRKYSNYYNWSELNNIVKKNLEG